MHTTTRKKDTKKRPTLWRLYRAGTLDGEEDFEDAIAQATQAEAVAYAAWGKAKGEGKGMRKGKGKGKGKGSKGKTPSTEESLRKLAELKARTNCHSCGQRGRWAGDEACPNSAPRATGTMSIAKEDSPLCAGFIRKDEIDEQRVHASVACMTTKGKGKAGRASATAPPAPATCQQHRAMDRARPRYCRGTSRAAFV